MTRIHRQPVELVVARRNLRRARKDLDTALIDLEKALSGPIDPKQLRRTERVWQRAMKTYLESAGDDWHAAWAARRCFLLIERSMEQAEQMEDAFEHAKEMHKLQRMDRLDEVNQRANAEDQRRTNAVRQQVLQAIEEQAHKILRSMEKELAQHAARLVRNDEILDAKADRQQRKGHLNNAKDDLRRQQTQDSIEAFEYLWRKWKELLADEKKTRTEKLQRWAEQETADAANAQGLAVYLSGLVQQAANDDVSIAMPTGFRVATTAMLGPSVDAITSLMSEVQNADNLAEVEQESVGWAIAHGLLPHPGDLSAILSQADADPAWADAFQKLADRMDDVEERSFRNVRLQLETAREQLSILGDEIDLIEAYSAERLLAMIVNPQQLKDNPTTQEPPQATPPEENTELDGLLDTLFS